MCEVGVISRFLLIFSLSEYCCSWNWLDKLYCAGHGIWQVWIYLGEIGSLLLKLVFQLWINLGDIGSQQKDSFLPEAGVPAVRYPSWVGFSFYQPTFGWQGPLSTAVFAPGTNLQNAIDSILYYRFPSPIPSPSQIIPFSNCIFTKSIDPKCILKLYFSMGSNHSSI